MLRVCVIGLGHIGNLHARIYQEDELVDLVGVCDIKQKATDVLFVLINLNFDAVSAM